MKKEVKTEESQTTKTVNNNKKYIVLALAALLVIIGIVMNNGNEEETISVSTKPEVTANIKEQLINKKSDTAHIDVTTKLVNAEKPQFDVYIDGSEIPEKQAEWMPKSGKQGYAFQRNTGHIDLKITSYTDEDINIRLLSPFQKDSKGNLIENWVEYTLFTINNNPIIKEPVLLWYNKPFIYTINVKAGNTYNVHVRWKSNKKI